MDEAFILVVSYIAIAVYICTVLGNILVIVVIQKDKKLRNSPNTFFLLSLAYSDFFFAIFIFLDIIILSNEVTIAYFEFFFNALASIYILVALAVERYFAILKPLVHMARARKCLLVKVLLAIYAVAIVLSTPGYLITYGRKNIDNKLQNTAINGTEVVPAWFQTLNRVYSFVLFIFGYILPCAGIIFCYSRVIYRAWFRTDSKRSTDHGLVKARRKLTKLFILVTVIFVLTWTPTFGRLIVTEYHERNQNTLKFELFSMLLGLVGAAANPVIFSFRCPKFRREVVKLLTCQWCFKPKIRPHSSNVIGKKSYSLTAMKSKRGNEAFAGPISLISMSKLVLS